MIVALALIGVGALMFFIGFWLGKRKMAVVRRYIGFIERDVEAARDRLDNAIENIGRIKEELGERRERREREEFEGERQRKWKRRWR